MPAGRVGRVAFGLLVAVASTLLMAPQTDEFGTKVGLLAGLVVVCAARPLLDRLVPEPRSAADDLGRFATRLVGARGRRAGRRRAGSAGSRLVVVRCSSLGVGIVAAGTPARGTVVAPDAAEVLDRRPARRRSGDVPVDLGRPGRARLRPRDRRAGAQADRAHAGREPRAREPGAPPRATRRSSQRSTTATGSTRCGPAHGGRTAVPVDDRRTTDSTRSTSRCSCRSARQTA